MPAGYRLIVFHPMDPRGTKLGGIETHVRLILANHPDEVDVLLVGIDEIGDLELGRVAPLVCASRSIDFLPVLRASPATVNAAATQVRHSLTLRYVLAALRRTRKVRRAVGAAPASCEIGRFEFALLPFAAGRRCALTVHNEGRRGDAMDSLLKRWWWLHRLNERIALHRADAIFAVNEAIAARVAGMSRRLAARTQVLSVAVDTRLFRPSPFPTEDDVLRVCYAGRLDAFKRPELMLAAVALAADRFAAEPVGRFRRIRLLYAGASDPVAVGGYGRLSDLVERRGILDARGVAALMRECHLGIIASIFEGLPCYLLEMLASGRPLAAVPLPQFAGLIEEGVSGRFCAIADDEVAATAMAAAMIAVATDIAEGRLDPEGIAAKVASRSVDAQMGKLFRTHRALAHRRDRAGTDADAGPPADG